MSKACGLCGKDPAEGFAEIDGVRYCHGDIEGPTCYMRVPHGPNTTVVLPEWAVEFLSDTQDSLTVSQDREEQG